MFDSWSQWHWVALSWGHLLLSYTLYLLYLRWRVKRLEEKLEDESSSG